MNDHSSHRRRSSQPAWPTGDDLDGSGKARPNEERTGFWSPLWEDDEDEAPRHGRSNGHANGRSNGGSNGHANGSANGHANGRPNGRSNGNGDGHANGHSNGHPNGHSNGGANGHSNGGANGNANGNANGTRSNGRAAHRLPESGGAHRPEPRSGPRHGAPSSSPAWPTEEPPAPAQPTQRTPASNGAAANGRPPADQRTRVVRPRPGGQPGGPARPGGAPAPGSAGVNMDGPTEMMPQVHKRRTGPEPELLTHREPGYDDPVDDGYDDDYYDDEDAPPSEDQKLLRRKRIWRRVRRTGYVLTALMIILPLLGFFVAYQIVTVPSPNTIADGQDQVAKLTYANDKLITEILPPGGENRRMVKYEELPEQVKNAVFAAEDAEFMTNPGFDIAGVMRAAWNQLSGGQGGGSTITQQYIKKATGNEEKSITRKALEVVQAYKMNNTYSKEDIITAYLNTIYFGRGAYGIAAAAKSYYNKELKDVTASEAALLAGMIQSPSRFDEPEYMTRRWEFVLGQMVNNGWFPAEQAKTEKFPQPEDWEKLRTKALTDYRAHIQQRVMDELAQEAGITEADIFADGLVIKTTIDPAAQAAAVKSVKEVMEDQPKEILPALVAVKPSDGSIVAYYGGSNGIGTDWAATPQEPGSSFKPFDLVALLQKGMGLGETYDGTSGRTFAGREAPVRNSNGSSCGEQCTVATAMEKSINTVFYEIAVEIVGTPAVRDAARQAGITSDLNGKKADDEAPDGNISIGGGDTQVSTTEMASAYATFASGGVYHKPHLVAEVRYPDGQVKWKPTPSTKTAFDEGDPDNNAKIARNVTESLMPVLESSDLECDGDWECAGKTGTHQFGSTENNAKAWMVGYSREISAAVSMGAERDQKQIPLMNSDGNIVYGSGLPGEVWLKFMNRYHKGKEPKDFPEFEAIGKTVEEAEAETRRNEDEDDGNNGGGNDDKPNRPGRPGDDEPTIPTGEPTIPTGEPTIPTGEPTIPTEPGPGDTFTPPFPPNGDDN